MARGEPLIRQWNLLKALQAHRFGIDAGELAERLECSKRQVQRDLGVLRKVGLPPLMNSRTLTSALFASESGSVEETSSHR